MDSEVLDPAETATPPAPTARQFKAIRAWFGWTQGEAADTLGLYLQTIADYELGKRQTSRVTMLQIARAIADHGIRFDDQGRVLLDP